MVGRKLLLKRYEGRKVLLPLQRPINPYINRHNSFIHEAFKLIKALELVYAGYEVFVEAKLRYGRADVYCSDDMTAHEIMASESDNRLSDKVLRYGVRIVRVNAKKPYICPICGSKIRGEEQ